MQVKYFIGIVICVLLGIGVVVFIRPSKDSARKKVIEDCRRVSKGIDRDSLQLIMGKPLQISFKTIDGVVEEQWLYDEMTGVESAPVRCDFDSISGLVIRVQCGD